MRPATMLLAVLVLAGCATTGSGDPAPTPTVPVSATPTGSPTVGPATSPEPGRPAPGAKGYVRAADRICARVLQTGRRAAARAAEIPDGDPGGFEALAAIWVDVVAAHREWLGALRELDVPPAAREAATALEENVTFRLVLTERIRAAFERHDPATAGPLTVDLYRMLERGAAVRARHGFETCGTGTPDTIAG